MNFMGNRKGKQRNFFIILSLCIIVGVASFLYQTQVGTNSSQSSSTVFKAAPDFELADSKGKKYRLENFRGNAVILHFWASWCPPCLDEIPQWVELGNAFKDRPIKLIAVSLDQTWPDALKILPSQKLSNNIISLLDTSSKVPDQYGSYQFPETYLLSRDLEIVVKWVGPQDWNSPEIRKLIEQVLNHS